MEPTEKHIKMKKEIKKLEDKITELKIKENRNNEMHNNLPEIQENGAAYVSFVLNNHFNNDPFDSLIKRYDERIDEIHNLLNSELGCDCFELNIECKHNK